MRRAMGCALLMLLCSAAAWAKPAQPADDEIAQRIIQQSMAEWRGNCACPYQLARNGSQCGRRSAYSKPGGYAPKCYREDVSDEDIARFRRRE
ncbi:hypothetical protein [Pseudomonas sp. NPDC007930]|uniref:hypothetical protein n=1 Tax=Pseudomonas sp. NPDC007930 TaxID=3364417 RepID=UPI0036EC6A13